ncbi:MAG TPA: hypothetical protein VL981_13490 [Candidatus Methylacidiphilales bacterium]|nr:hypothetical protein [Candidatus Methylacidiphilales bacterium]
MEPGPSLPPLNDYGCLPEGVHDGTFGQLRERFAFNPARLRLCDRLEEFMRWAVSLGEFSHAYINGGFITNKAAPADIDVILQTCAPFGTEAFRAMEPFFAKGLDTILEKYSVHLHFWCEGFPGGLNDFRRFFQYQRPQDAAPLGLRQGAKKGIVRIKL